MRNIFKIITVEKGEKDVYMTGYTFYVKYFGMCKEKKICTNFLHLQIIVRGCIMH